MLNNNQKNNLNKLIKDFDFKGSKKYKLIVLLGLLGDFDSFEYAINLKNFISDPQNKNIDIFAIAIGNKIGKDKFCKFTGFPTKNLEVVFDNKIHQELYRSAKEIMKTEKPSNLQKLYDQTLLLFEQLIIIKNSERFSKEFLQELGSKHNNTIDLIKSDEKENMLSDFQITDCQDSPNLNNTTKDIFNEIKDTKSVEAEMLDVTPQNLSFEPKEEVVTQKEITKERLNDKFSKGLQIDLNDRIAFIKHLFDQSPNDYQRAISQISTFQDWDQAKVFILEIVKLDYDNWNGKELYEERFLKIIENNF